MAETAKIVRHEFWSHCHEQPRNKMREAKPSRTETKFIACEPLNMKASTYANDTILFYLVRIHTRIIAYNKQWKYARNLICYTAHPLISFNSILSNNYTVFSDLGFDRSSLSPKPCIY